MAALRRGQGARKREFWVRRKGHLISRAKWASKGSALRRARRFLIYQVLTGVRIRDPRAFLSNLANAAISLGAAPRLVYDLSQGVRVSSHVEPRPRVLLKYSALHFAQSVFSIMR